MLLLSCPVQWCGSCPTHPTAVLASNAVMSCTVLCQVLRCVGVRVCAVVFVWWGILCLLPPRRGWWVGLSWMVGGVVVVGGMVREGGSVTDSPSNVGVPRLCVGVPLVVYSVVSLKGGSGVCCAALCRIGSGILHCSTPFRIVQSPSSLCVCCHSIVGLGLCLCDRVMSLWNGGVGLWCGSE